MDLTGIIAQNPEMASLGAGAIGGALAAIGTVFIIFTVLIGALMIVSRWRIFEKAELPGRGALIPIYNIYLMFKLAGKPEWTRRLLLPPVAGVLAIVAQFKISKKFGKTDMFAVGLWFLPFIFCPILAFSEEVKYNPEA